MRTVYLLGVGHNTPVFMDLVEQSSWEIKGLYHFDSSRTGEYVNNIPILGSFEELFALGQLNGRNFVLTMGDNKLRSIIASKIRLQGGHTPSIFHPSTVISKRSTISEKGVIVNAFTIIQANASIGDDTIILSGVNISHDNNIGRGCFIAGGAIIGAYTRIGEFVFIGQGSLTISGKVESIGDFAFVGAGSLVTRSIDPNVTVSGRPARSIER
ncbi:transferase [Sphingobacterium sp. JB170]|uniref:transferase n=1 Tax=Sphingobacterium sp. JB170 TaxID=1434842 RepID=UPI00097F1635|nr:transferase [Sphingobacterium sp. JB170]SJN28683.1 4-amino-6-deoxy-N-Acetyl-D-hexosaminyl-(Lipid carrier) acetyltrasferase [Sphingobacterium sp. JB170]